MWKRAVQYLMILPMFQGHVTTHPVNLANPCSVSVLLWPWVVPDTWCKKRSLSAKFGVVATSLLGPCVVKYLINQSSYSQHSVESLAVNAESSCRKIASSPQQEKKSYTSDNVRCGMDLLLSALSSYPVHPLTCRSVQITNRNCHLVEVRIAHAQPYRQGRLLA